MKNKFKIILYYLCILISIITFYLAYNSNITFYSIRNYSFVVFLILNAALMTIFTIQLFRRTLSNYKLIAPIMYILFCIIMIIISYIFSIKRIIGALSMPYYAMFVIIGFTIFNIYSLLSLETKKPIKK